MPVRKGSAQWNGNLKDGNGSVKTESGVLDAQYSFGSRFAEGKGTNPEELIGAAHAGCFSMALSAALSAEGFTPTYVKTEDKVYVEKVGEGFSITKILVSTEAEIPNIDNETFQKFAEDAKKSCPVSRALAGTEFILTAVLK